jgi:hypothetical protein
MWAQAPNIIFIGRSYPGMCNYYAVKSYGRRIENSGQDRNIKIISQIVLSLRVVLSIFSNLLSCLKKAQFLDDGQV